MLALYEEHAKQIIEVCPTSTQLEYPSTEQLNKLIEIRKHCLKWCAQEWEYAYKEAQKQLGKFDTSEIGEYNVLV